MLIMRREDFTDAFLDVETTERMSHEPAIDADEVSWV
jgi:hypothetical protein